MLDAAIKSQVQGYLADLDHPIEITASLDNTPASAQMSELLQEIAELGHIQLSLAGNAQRRPSFRLNRPGADLHLHFAGNPLGHEFSSLILALLQVGGRPPKVDAETQARIQSLKGPLRFETFYSQSCQNCPDVVQALNLMAILNPNIEHIAIDGALFQQEVEDRQILSVPSVYLNGEAFGQGRMDVQQILSRLDTSGDAAIAERLNAAEPYDVLIVGGGPAGASAAVYAARKGIRTGLIAERFGGQVLDTLAIENLISVPETEGPKLARALEEHVRQYPVELINGQQVVKLQPAQSGPLHEVHTASGAVLKSKTLILATGARWRELNVPGEQTYRARGVAYCPHCDGPLFKGKAVAVIGGGNSGVEAAIDLAGITAHVTLLEFDASLRADAVLQNKLHSLPNVTVITQAQTTEVLGDGQKVTALRYRDRTSGEDKEVALAGIFVQIGLLPNSEWLKGIVELSARGEIITDAHGATSIPGIFAAGDVTTVPYKQIVVALGEGARAALGAFDHLIRHY